MSGATGAARSFLARIGWGATLGTLLALAGIAVPEAAPAAEPTADVAAAAAGESTGGTCEATVPLPDMLQVAWVSRLGARANAGTPLEVVRVADLRRLVEARGRDPGRVLQALGLVGKQGKVHGGYKVTLFDVNSDWLCRPATGAEGAPLMGLATCPTEWQRHGAGTRPRSYSGCGYLLDVATAGRTLDVFRVEWQVAVTRGFCVLPLQRFLDGA
jgi:hypothetical protein